MNPGLAQPYNDDPNAAAASGYYDPYRGPVPPGRRLPTQAAYAGRASPGPQIATTGRASPGPGAAYGGM
ncbi:hypothetical protein B0H14DRAFT_3431885 [Mycena olivaceomarginata]|nr:hypothetical protein B0H14DRAFT_3431885 [Mycena olivaceomarginata]